MIGATIKPLNISASCIEADISMNVNTNDIPKTNAINTAIFT